MIKLPYLIKRCDPFFPVQFGGKVYQPLVQLARSSQSETRLEHLKENDH